jgi:hypothetical protein
VIFLSPFRRILGEYPEIRPPLSPSLSFPIHHSFRVLRRIFGPKRDEVTGEWRKLHSEELHNFVRQVKANEVGGACGTHGRGEKSVQDFGGKARRKVTTGKTEARIGWDQNREYGDEPSGSGATELVIFGITYKNRDPLPQVENLCTRCQFEPAQ